MVIFRRLPIGFLVLPKSDGDLPPSCWLLMTRQQYPGHPLHRTTGVSAYVRKVSGSVNDCQCPFVIYGLSFLWWINNRTVQPFCSSSWLLRIRRGADRQYCRCVSAWFDWYGCQRIFSSLNSNPCFYLRSYWTSTKLDAPSTLSWTIAIFPRQYTR